MTDYAAQVPSMSNKGVFVAKGEKKLVVLSGRTTIGAAGAIGTQTVDDPGITFTKNAGTGDYAITYPKGTHLAGVITNLVSVANTVNGWNLKAVSATSGTLNIITTAAGTATNPASGDEIRLLLFIEGA